MATMLGLLQAKAPENRKRGSQMTSEFSSKFILRTIFFVYIYMMMMASANVLNCEVRKHKECGDQWTQAFTVSGGAITTLWAYITDNPLQSGSKSPVSSPRKMPTPNSQDDKRRQS